MLIVILMKIILGGVPGCGLLGEYIFSMGEALS